MVSVSVAVLSPEKKTALCSAMPKFQTPAPQWSFYSVPLTVLLFFWVYLRTEGLQATSDTVRVQIQPTYRVSNTSKEPAILDFIRQDVPEKSLSEHYAKNIAAYGNKCDMDLYKLLLPRLRCCTDPSKVLLTGGMNQGQLVDALLEACPGPHIHGEGASCAPLRCCSVNLKFVAA